jgi:glyoxylase-like metal-dependent hydrolase (beta-lactamase superfamily II)
MTAQTKQQPALPDGCPPGWMAGTITINQALPRRPVLHAVAEGVWCAQWFGVSNIIFVATARGIVAIDSTESIAGAAAALEELRKVCPLPVTHLIYTHCHDDHFRGARAFSTPRPRVIAQRRFPELFDKWRRLQPHHGRRLAQMFDNPPPLPAPDDFYVPPDVLVDESYRFEEGGVVFELSHTQGETVDHLMIWLPHVGVLCPGDLFCPSFPMMGSPMNTDERPALAWIESLHRMRALKPEHLVAGHGRPYTGAGEIDSVLGNYAEAIRFVHDETVQGVNEGLPLEAIRRRVRLPERLAKLPYLAERYGAVRWGVNGVYRQHTGWYSGNPKDLDPSPRATVCRALVAACRDTEALLEQARQALELGRNPLVLELTDIILNTSADDGAALALRAEAVSRLAQSAKNGVARNIYRLALHSPLPGIQRPLERSKDSTVNPNSRQETGEQPAPRADQNGSARRVRKPAPLIILAPPRSFTSVIGAMLGQHPQLYGFAETRLFAFESMEEWWQACGGERRLSPEGHGLVRVVAELFFGEQTEKTAKQATGWLRRRLHLKTGDLLKLLARRLAPLALVEKTPLTASRIESMRRALATFPNAHFLHLLRHPRGQAESFIKYDRFREDRKGAPPPRVSARQAQWEALRTNLLSRSTRTGEQAEPLPVEFDFQWFWYATHRTILDFLGEAPAGQVLRMRGEDLLANPDAVLPKLCHWLGLRDDAEAIEAMKHPERSPFACYGPRGARCGNDLLFLEDPMLRPMRSELPSLDGPLSWSDGNSFAPAVRRLAEEFGYT